jgi:hypothetical protein
MAISLYDATVANFLQTLGSVDGFLARGLEHCRANNIDPESVVSGHVPLPLSSHVDSDALHRRHRGRS